MDNFNNPENNTPNFQGGASFGNVTPNAPQDIAPVYNAPQDTAPVYGAPSGENTQTNTYSGNFTGATAEWQATHQTTTNGNDIYGAPYANQFATPASSYQAVTAPKKDKTGIAFAIISLVCGILGLICCCLLGIWSLIITIPGLVLGIVSLIKKFAGKGMAIAGVICSGLAIVLAIVLAIFSALGLSYLNDYMDDLGYSYDYNY